MVAPVAPASSSYKVNLPKLESEKIGARLIHLLPPKPIDPTIPGDDLRFEEEYSAYNTEKIELIREKQICDNLAHAVEMAINPDKRIAFAEKYFKFVATKEERAAFIAKFGIPKYLK